MGDSRTTRLGRSAVRSWRILLLAPALALGACSAKQLYQIGQEWQRSQCQKIDDRSDRSRCEQSASLSYERYQAELAAPVKP